MTDLSEQDSRRKPTEEYFDDLMELHEIAIGFEQLERERIRNRIPERQAKTQFRKHFRRIDKAAVLIRSQKIFMLNRRLRLLLGYPNQKAVGTLFSKYIHPSELPRVAKNHLNRLAGKDEAEAVYTTILVNRSQAEVPVKLQVAKIIFLEEAMVLGILSRLEGSGESLHASAGGINNSREIAEPCAEND